MEPCGGYVNQFWNFMTPWYLANGWS